jgi:peptide/nickel transport system substrate-binding protein
MRDKIVGNPLVRQAIAHAIDKQKIIKYVLSGMAVPADTLLPESDPFHAKALNAPGYDPEAAKALLDQAGFKAGEGGKRLALSFKTTTDLTRVAVAKAIAAELKKIGVDVTVETLEWGRFKADVEGGRVQMWSLSWIGFKDPDIYRFAFASESFPPNGGNRGWYSNPNLDKLLADGKAETDQGKRAGIYAKAEQVIADDEPYVFLWHEEVFAVVNKSVEGFEVYADGRLSSLANAVKK